MKIVSSVFVIILAVAAVCVAGAPDERYEAQAEYASKALQQAVELVSWTHAPEGNVYLADGEILRIDDRRPRIGVVVKTRYFGDEPEGAVIDAVTPGGPADEAGLRAGDVITHVDGRKLAEGGFGGDPRVDAGVNLVKWSHDLSEGQRITLDYIRNGEAASVTLEAREMDGGPWAAPSVSWFTSGEDGGGLPGLFATGGAWTFPSAWLDMELVQLNPELGEYFSTDRGVLVVRAPEDDSLGIEAGDVILDIDGREVRDPSHAMRILRSYEPDEQLALGIVRHGRNQTLTGTVPESTVELLGDHGWTILERD